MGQCCGPSSSAVAVRFSLSECAGFHDSACLIVFSLSGVDPDENNDGFVDAADAGIMFGEWTGDSGPVSVPEPVSLGWTTAAIIAVAYRKGIARC